MAPEVRFEAGGPCHLLWLWNKCLNLAVDVGEQPLGFFAKLIELPVGMKRVAQTARPRGRARNLPTVC